MNKEEAVGHFAAGTMVDEIRTRFGYTERSDFDQAMAACVEAHNEHMIDLLALVETPAFQALTPTDFFVVQNFFRRAIPRLDAPIDQMMRCVILMVTRGGTDMAANEPNGAFREWCKAEPTRPKQIIELARSKDPAALKLLTFALEAANAIDEAREFAQAGSGEGRLGAILALGRIHHLDGASIAKTLSTLSASMDVDDDDILRATILDAVFSLHALANRPVGEAATDLIQRTLTSAGDTTKYAAARNLWLHAKLLNSRLVALLLGAFPPINPEHKGTVRDLDTGLEALMGTEWYLSAVDLVTALV